METQPETNEAFSDLNAAHDAQRSAAAQFRTPWWYHIATGLVLAAAIISFAYLPTQYWVGPILILLVLGQLLRRAYQRRMRIWGYGLRAGWALLWNLPVLIAGVGGILLSLRGGMDAWVPWVSGGIVGLVAVACGAAFDATLRRRFRRDDAR